MFGSLVAARDPAGRLRSSASASACRWSVWWPRPSTCPTTAPTVATLLGLGVAVDYGLFLVARHREQLDHGMDMDESIGKTTATSGAAVVVAGSTVVIAILGLYVSGVPFVGALGLASAIVVAVTMLSALTLVPAFLAISRRPGAAVAARDGARRPPEATPGPTRHENSAFARWGRMVSDSPGRGRSPAWSCCWSSPIPVLLLRLGQLDAGTDPTSQTDRRAYDLIAEGFGAGANGPLTVVLTLPKESSRTPRASLTSAQKTLHGHRRRRRRRRALGQLRRERSRCSTSSRPPHRTTQATTDLVDHLRDDVLPGLGATDDLPGRYDGGLRRLHREGRPADDLADPGRRPARPDPAHRRVPVAGDLVQGRGAQPALGRRGVRRGGRGVPVGLGLASSSASTRTCRSRRSCRC